MRIFAVCPDSGCACYSLKSQYPQIVTSLLFRKRGHFIKLDYTEQKKLAAAVSRVASNFNQICRHINSTGHVYEDDVAEMKARQTEIWELLKERQKEEP